MKKDKIMVFIPVYNCEKQITRVLSQINDDVLTYVDEIIVVNNLSTDDTVKVTQDYLLKHRELPCKIINNNANFNLGGSHKVAFNYALENDLITLLSSMATIRRISEIFANSEKEKL